MDRRKPSPHCQLPPFSAPTDILEIVPCYSYHPRGVGNEAVFHSFFSCLGITRCHWKGSKGKMIQFISFPLVEEKTEAMYWLQSRSTSER